MKHKKWPIYIWFLDKDLHKSASYLTDKALLRSIDGCIGALVSTHFYEIGIRSKKFYDYFFAKERADETIDRFFPSWPMSKKPSFAAYGRKESKWCRSCRENYDFTVAYLEALLDEHSYRDSSKHSGQAFYEWLVAGMMPCSLPKAGLEDIVLPWKAVDPKFRRVDTIEGYRLQFMESFEDGDPFKAYGSTCRDIPQFVIDYFNCSQALES